MDEKTQSENEALREMFQSVGWKVLMRNTQAYLDAFREGFPFNVDTVEQLYFSRGTVAALNVLLHMEDQMDAQDRIEEESDPFEPE